MPTTITFKDFRALRVFHGMCEGREEIQRDNGEPDDIARADALTRLIEVTGRSMHRKSLNVTIILPDDLVEEAEITLENCLDVSMSHDLHPGDPNAEDYLFLGDVVIQRPYQPA